MQSVVVCLKRGIKMRHVICIHMTILYCVFSVLGCAYQKEFNDAAVIREPLCSKELSPSRAIPVPVKFTNRLPSVINDEDRIAIIDILGRIPVLGSPVIVDEMIAWPGNEPFVCGVVCAVNSHQVFLVRTTANKWCLSEIIFIRYD